MDLAMPTSKQRWIVAAACSDADCGDLVQRLTAEWSLFSRNCPVVKLPELHIERHRTWSATTQRGELAQAFLSFCQGEGHESKPAPTVLVVDDDCELSQCLSVRLQSAGFHVMLAADGEEGVSAAVSHHPDAIVLDVRMPRKDGLTALRELRATPDTTNTPVIMLSASIQDQQSALQAGASFFVRKPYEAEEVLSAIESSIKETAS
jgi:CheY-like chemotaxis protein